RHAPVADGALGRPRHHRHGDALGVHRRQRRDAVERHGDAGDARRGGLPPADDVRPGGRLRAADAIDGARRGAFGRGLRELRGGGSGAAGWNGMEPPGAPGGGASLPPMTYDQAVAYVQQTRSTALVEVHSDEVFVNFAGATFPLNEDGQIALVRRFVQADEIVEGKRRRIYFYNPAGRLFAQSDRVTGVTIKR